jgi:transposase
MAGAVRAGRRLLPAKPRAAVDSTGYEARAVSRYFVVASGRRSRQRHWPKLTVVLDTASHLFLAARVARGPTQDAPHLLPAVRDAAGRHPIDTVLADAGYDSEANHTAPRQFGVRATVIALNWRGSRTWPKTRFRRQMVGRFRKKPAGSRSKRVYGQRWQVESGFSRNKRLLGSAVRATTWVNQKKELLLRVIVHNLMLLAAGP